MYFVYIVRCRDGSLYTGTAADLRRRMHAHTQQTAACARYTRSHPVAALEAAWRTQTRPEALRLEALIKRLTREDFVNILSKPDNALTRQYAALLETDKVHLTFEEDALQAIAEAACLANEAGEEIGARRLHAEF